MLLNIPTWTVLLVLFSIICRFWLFPQILSWFSNWRVDSISPLSFVGLEYRPSSEKHAVIPRLRLDRGRFGWGGLKEDEVGLFVFRLEGVSWRIRKTEPPEKHEESDQSKNKKFNRWIYWRNRALSSTLHMFIHHYPSFARILSFQITDIRVIFDDLDGLELTVGTTSLGVKVDFEGDVEPAEIKTPTMRSPNPQGAEDAKRAYPLFSPPPDSVESNPLASPTGFFSSFVFPLPPNFDPNSQPSRMESARRRASHFQSRMSSTATQIWSRAIARAHGSVTLASTISDIAIILPHDSSPAITARPSIPDFAPSQHPHANGLSNRASNKSFASHRDRPKSFVSVRSINSLLHPPPPKYALPSAEGGYERILVIGGKSRAIFGLGFGPRKGLLGEDTLKAEAAFADAQTSVGSVEKVLDLVKAHNDRKAEEESEEEKPEKPEKESQWSPAGLPRIILRAFESVAVSLSHCTVSHYLPMASPTGSAASSSTEISDMLQAHDDALIPSLEINSIACQLSAADSSSNERTRNAFGTNSNPESKVRGVGFRLQWNTITVQCIGSGEAIDEKSQLFQIRSADFEGCSTWRPSGWSREELLFANDPNLALIVGRGGIASIDVAADLQLLQQLNQAFKHQHIGQKVSESKAESGNANARALLPRVRAVLDVGQTMLLVVDPSSENKTTLTVASDGFHFGCFTSYSDIIARRNKTATKAAFKQEAELRSRREGSGASEDYSQPVPMLKPQYRRTFAQSPAKLRDDFSISMRADASLDIEPLTMHISLSAEAQDQKTFHIASTGRAHMTLFGDVLGKQDFEEDGKEVSYLVPSARSFSFDLGVDHGIKMDVWETRVIDALTAMVNAHRPTPKTAEPTQRTTLDRLISGINVRLSFGLISVFFGVTDPNPNCKLGIIRGLWLQTQATLEHAHYATRTQVYQCGHSLLSANRTKLRLPADLTTQALAIQNQLSERDGSAALFACTLVDTFVKPIFNGERFLAAGGTALSHEPVAAPKWRHDPGDRGWDFRRHQNDDPSYKSGKFANNLPPLEISEAEQAQRPLLRLPNVILQWKMEKEASDKVMTHALTGNVDKIEIVADLSHIYCALLATLAVRRIISATKSEHHEKKQRDPIKFSMDVSAAILTAHLVYPLGEHMFLYIRSPKAAKKVDGQIHGVIESAMVYVPSPREIGAFEELLRLRGLDISGNVVEGKREFAFVGDTMRLRIPFGYLFSKLVLNCQLAAKGLKLLLDDLGKDAEFLFIRKPTAEEPKRLPKISFEFRYMSLEAKDSPIETRLNLIWRVGISHQPVRNNWEDAYEHKIQLVRDAISRSSGDVSLNDDHDSPNGTKLTDKMLFDFEDARYRLDALKAQEWKRKIDAALRVQERREKEILRKMGSTFGPERKLPITLAAPTRCVPLFRVALEGVKLAVEGLTWSRDEIVDYMGKVSAPFDEGTEFSLMIPLQLSWSFNSGCMKLRDYPLDLVNIPATKDGSPSWTMDTPFIIAEELQGDDSAIYIPTEVIPPGTGHKDAAAFTVQVAKTVMPVKTYSRPVVQINTEGKTEFTWGNSYQPAIQDLMKVIESLSHPPRDPSPRVGFWDKFRLILHWKVTVNFVGPVHLHLKGSLDPYSVADFGSGFALSWSGGTKLEIAQPNEQHETIQITANELLIAIPDLSALHDGAALGGVEETSNPSEDSDEPVTEGKNLIDRRYTKPCARFQNGVRVGFGFVLERTCRPWNCKQKCGSTDNLLHRQCRIMEFEKHQKVILRSEEAVDRDTKKLGRQLDSFEGFRSDWIHFSVSCVAPLNPCPPGEMDSNRLNGLHFSPKAFAHFFAWWRLFDGSASLPIRQGKLFPNSPPPSKKFGKSLATIKYRFDLAPVYVSHVYPQVTPDLWSRGKSQALGVKARFGRFRADMHQRAQEKVVRHEKLHRTSVVVHKPFYAVDLLLDDVEVKGLRVDFCETHAARHHNGVHEDEPDRHASMLEKEKRDWYNFFDYIDADRKPFDRNPEVDIVDFGDCPTIFISKRVKARQSTALDDDSSSLNSTNDSRMELESSKFGHEKSHYCYLGAADGVGPTQIRITRERLQELEKMKKNLNKEDTNYDADMDNIQGRIKTLLRHLEELSSKEKRGIDADTFQNAYVHPLDKETHTSSATNFENTFHLHCPRIFWTNKTRNIVYKYWFSSRDRKKEEYMTSHKSLRGLHDGIARRMHLRDQPSLNIQPSDEDTVQRVLRDLEGILLGRSPSKRFQLSSETDDEGDLSTPSKGLPPDCVVKPQNLLLVLKPQIALRSDVDEESLVLVAPEEILFKGYRVLDETTTDLVAAEILDRNYITMKGLQAFYPTGETMRRERGPFGVPRGLDFVPLEIFVDVRSEATDYDRIVLKADASLSFDKFNHLRLPRGLDWPSVKDENGHTITHLRLHQDMYTVVVPRLTVSATSRHYTALYNVVTDLIMYQDPEHQHRSERIDNFIFAFDRKDRDPQKLILELFQLQQDIRSLAALQKGYEAHVDLLDDAGKAELFKIRADHLEGMEQLFTVFEAVAVNQARDDARAALKTASRMDVRIGGLAWHTLRDDMKPLVKVDVEGALYSRVSNKDGSADHAMAFGDLSALNSNPDALYPEVIVRYESSGYTGYGKRKARECFASIFMSTLAPVGGIQIVRHLAVNIHPVRFKLEEKVGHQIVDYVFNDRVKRRNKKAEAKEAKSKQGLLSGHGHHGRNGDSNGHGHLFHASKDVVKTQSGMELPPLNRSKSQVSINSQNTAHRMSEETVEGDNKFTMVPIKDAAEMRRRASHNKTFGKIVFASTSLVLSYKSDDSRKHGTISMPDCVDFKLKTPEMIYTNKVWGYEDVFEHFKRDTRNYAWSQTGDLVSQILKKTSVFRSKKTLKHVATLSSELSRRDSRSRLSLSPSRLRHSTDPAPPSQDEIQNTIALARAVSREQDLSRRATVDEDGAQVLGLRLTDAPDDLSDSDDSERDEPSHGVGKAVKGFLGRLRPRHSGRSDSNSSFYGSEAVSHSSLSDRIRSKNSPSISSSSSSRDHSAVVQ